MREESKEFEEEKA